MTSIWVAEQGWCYLNAAIDCCTCEIVAYSLRAAPRSGSSRSEFETLEQARRAIADYVHA